MKNTLRQWAMLLLLTAAMPAMAGANWVWLGEDAQAEIYLDSAGLERMPGFVKAWTLLSFKTRHSGGWLSEKRLLLFSCKDRSFAWLQSMYYDDRMSDGAFLQARTLNRYGTKEWRSFAPGRRARDAETEPEAVPETRFAGAFTSLC